MTRRGFLSGAATGFRAAGERRLRITRVRAVPLRVRGEAAAGPTERKSLPDTDPARWRQFGPFSQLTGAILVEICTDRGIIGYGMGGGGTAACYIIEHHLSELLAGLDPLNIQMIWDQLFASTSFYGRRGVVVMALSGIDLALWDIAGKHAGKPVHELLGGPTRENVPGYYTGNDIERGLKLGFRGVKISGFEDARRGRDGARRAVERILESRKRTGPEPLLMIDVLSAWDVAYTLDVAERSAEAKLHFIEEPLLPDDSEGYARLCREVHSTRIASGEHEATRFGFQELIRNRAAHILQPDITWSGGLTECRRIAAMADAAGLPLVPHRGGSVYGMTLLCTLRGQTLAESFGTGDSGNQIMELLTPQLEKGCYLPPKGPGFGVEFSDAILRKYAPGLL